MLKFKYINTSSIYTNDRLTLNKVYGVIEYSKSDYNRNLDHITILNDMDDVSIYYFNYDNPSMFIDVTAEYRNDIIDEILS